MKYTVKSRHAVDTEVYVENATDAFVVVETTRTDKRTAQEDVKLIQDIFHRKAWIEEVND